MKFNDCKVTIMGIQGSGKTELAKYLMKSFKKPAWYLMHQDDAKGIMKHTKIIVAENKSIEELNQVCGWIIKMGKKKLIDCLVIDEADMFLKQSIQLPFHLNDLVINHRHYNLSVIFLTRRPQDIPTKIIESCEHSFIFALPNSDNIERKMKALHKDLPELQQFLTKDKHNFIHIQLGKNPQLKNPIKIMKGGIKS